MKRISLLVLALGATTLVACDGLKEALTAHVDIVAKAGKQELSVTRLGDLLGKAKMQIPVNRDIATLIARDLWVPYQLLGIAAAHGDSLKDSVAIDNAASAMLENLKLGKFMESVSAKLVVDSTGGEADYNAGKGDLYSARHILFAVPKDAPPTKRDSVHKLAESVLAKINSANFADMAKKYSADNTSQKGGDLGVFPRGMMVKPFSDALAKLKPGEISPLVETEFGYHIIQRNTWDLAKANYAQQAGGRGRQVAESTYIAGIQNAAKIDVKPTAAAAVKDLAKDPMSHRNDNTALATYQGGTLTAGRVALVIMASPQSGRLEQQIAGAPDSLVTQYVKGMAQRDVLLKKADSAKIALPAAQLDTLHRDFAMAIAGSWNALGIDPKSLADSGKSVGDRERIAAARIESYMDRVMAGVVQPLPIPTPVQLVLMNKYDAKFNPAGVDRAVEHAAKLRTSADSARAAAQPKSAVPLPGMPGAGAGAPPSAVPAPSKP